MENPSFILGIVFLCLDEFFFVYNILALCEGETNIFNGFIYIIEIIKYLRIFEEAINERRRLPPKIILSKNDTNSGDNTNNDQNWKQELEYEYCSWEDNTYFNLTKYSEILKCQLEVKLNENTKIDIDNLKNDFKNKGYDEVLISFQSFNKNEECFSEYGKCIYKFLIFLWFILFILGYLDIHEFFIFTEREKIYIKITKLVSNTMIFRAYYNKNDEKLESYKKFNKKRRLYFILYY